MQLITLSGDMQSSCPLQQQLYYTTQSGDRYWCWLISYLICFIPDILRYTSLYCATSDSKPLYKLHLNWDSFLKWFPSQDYVLQRDKNTMTTYCPQKHILIVNWITRSKTDFSIYLKMWFISPRKRTTSSLYVSVCMMEIKLDTVWMQFWWDGGG
jgi:hypothetical protein